MQRVQRLFDDGEFLGTEKLNDADAVEGTLVQKRFRRDVAICLRVSDNLLQVGFLLLVQFWVVQHMAELLLDRFIGDANLFAQEPERFCMFSPCKARPRGKIGAGANRRSEHLLELVLSPRL